MEEIEENFKIFQRPSAEQSREMADYIYELEKRLSTTHNNDCTATVQEPSPKSPDGDF